MRNLIAFAMLAAALPILADSQGTIQLPLGSTKLMDIGIFDVGYQSYGKDIVMYPKGWIGDFHAVSGIANAHGYSGGRRFILLHSPWRVEPGRTFLDYTLKLPKASKASLTFGYAMRNGMVGKDKSDGVTFSCYTFKPGEEPVQHLKQHCVSTEWTDVVVDLSSYTENVVVIRFQVEPGPNQDASFDYSHFSEPIVQVGDKKDEIPLGQAAKKLMEAQAIKAQMQVPMNKLWNNPENGVVPSCRFEHENKLIKTNDGWNFTYEGPDCKLTYAYVPKLGSLEDFTLQRDDFQPFLIAQNGTLKLGETTSNTLKPSFVNINQDGNKLHVAIDYELVQDKTTVRANWTFQIIGKALVIHVACDKPLAQGLALGNTGLTPIRKQISIPYFRSLEFQATNGLYSCRVTDWTRCDASYATGTYTTYNKKTDGTRNLLNDYAYIAYSPDPCEVLPNIPHKQSNFRKQLAPKIMLDFWGSKTASYANDGQHLRKLKDIGIDNVAIIYHNWQRYGYDVKLPDHIPANPAMGGDEQMVQFGKAANDCGYLWSLHENYIDIYPDAPSYDQSAVALTQSGEMSKAWFNRGTKVQSYGLKCNRALDFAKMNSPEIHRRYNTNAAYLDVHSCVSPSHQLDHQADQPMAANARFKVIQDSKLFDYMRETHRGPLFGEGGSHYYWAGACDGVEAQVAGGEGHRPFLDFTLLKIHRQMVNHGMGYYERWHRRGYSLVFGFDAGSQDRIDKYRTQEIAYGHAGFVSGAICFSTEWVAREHNLVSPAQALYANADVVNIQYDADGTLVPISVALALDSVTRQKITYDNGTVVYANWDEKTWDIDGFQLPQWATVVKNGNSIVKTAFEPKPGLFADYAENDDAIFADARTTFDMPYLKGKKPLARLQVESFKDLEDGSFQISYKWTPLQNSDGPCSAFVHFIDPKETLEIRGIKMQNDHRLPAATNNWLHAGPQVAGPFTVKVQTDTPKEYLVVAGLYNKKGRLPLDNRIHDKGRFILGKISVQRDLDNKPTKVTFTPNSLPPHSKDERQIDFTKRINPSDTIIDFGKIQTDGAVKIQKIDGKTVIFSYPEYKDTIVKLDTAALKLGNPNQLTVKALKPFTHETIKTITPTIEGKWLVFNTGDLNAGRFIIEKTN